MFVDVIEHFNNPIEYLKRFSKHSKALLFTQSFGEHDEARGGMPYHQDFKMKDINKFLVMLGYTKIKLDIVIPPYFYRR